LLFVIIIAFTFVQSSLRSERPEEVQQPQRHPSRFSLRAVAR